jgi:hypothetical protein
MSDLPKLTRKANLWGEKLAGLKAEAAILADLEVGAREAYERADPAGDLSKVARKLTDVSAQLVANATERESATRAHEAAKMELETAVRNATVERLTQAVSEALGRTPAASKRFKDGLRVATEGLADLHRINADVLALRYALGDSSTFPPVDPHTFAREVYEETSEKNPPVKTSMGLFPSVREAIVTLAVPPQFPAPAVLSTFTPNP